METRKPGTINKDGCHDTLTSGQLIFACGGSGKTTAVRLGAVIMVESDPGSSLASRCRLLFGGLTGGGHLSVGGRPRAGFLAAMHADSVRFRSPIDGFLQPGIGGPGLKQPTKHGQKVSCSCNVF